jgi:hypothetical protein
VAGLTALTLLHLSESSSVKDDGMRAVTTSLTHIESAGTPVRVREVHWRVMRGVGCPTRAVGAAWGLVLQHCGIAAEVTRRG